MAVGASAAAIVACYCAGAAARRPETASHSSGFDLSVRTGIRADARTPGLQWRGVLTKKSKLRVAAGRFCPLALGTDGCKLAEVRAGTKLAIVHESKDKKGSSWLCVTISESTQAHGWVPKTSVRIVGVTDVPDKYTPVAEIGVSFDVLTAPRPEMWIALDRPVILTCEHAGASLPTGSICASLHNSNVRVIYQLGGCTVSCAGYDWGPADSRLVGTHWCVDIGIREVCLEVQAALGCPAVLARYSRLFCDCNRPLPVRASTKDKSSTNNAEQGGASAVSRGVVDTELATPSISYSKDPFFGNHTQRNAHEILAQRCQAYLTSPFCSEAEGQPIELNTVGLPDDTEVRA